MVSLINSTLLYYDNLTTLVFRGIIVDLLIANAEKGNRNLMIVIVFLHRTQIPFLQEN